MEKIINKAIEGGYASDLEIKEVSDLGIYGRTKSENKYGINNCTSDILLDPLFWQALSKSCGWKEKNKHSFNKEDLHHLRCNRCDQKPMIGDGKCNWNLKNEWLEKAMNFQEINLTQGFSKAVEYLKDLIANQN